MYEIIFLWALALIYISFAVIQDLKTREIDNWINFSLVIFALGFRFLYSLFQQNFEFFFSGLIGFGIFFILGNALYYTRIFAGGDAKLMIALGAVLAPSELSSSITTFFNFILIFLFVGFFYTMITSIFICIKNFNNFRKEFSRQLKIKKKLMLFVLFFSIILLLFGFIQSVFFLLGILVFSISYLFLYSKAVDESCMVKKIKTKDLQEGDWLYSDLKIGKRMIRAKWDGLTKNDIREIKKRYKQIRIRKGIPFSPVFLISFILFIIFTIFNIKLWNPFW